MLHKQHAMEVLASLSFFTGTQEWDRTLLLRFCSDLIILTLSSYYSQIFGVVDVCDVCHSRYFCDEGSIGAIALSLAAVSCVFAYIHIHGCP